MESLDKFWNICVSPAPAKCRACSAPSRAGCHLCPGFLGCGEPGWCQLPPPPAPRASPASPRPWRWNWRGGHSAKEGQDWLSRCTSCSRKGLVFRWAVLKDARAGPVCGWRSCWCSAQANSNEGDTLARPYIHLAAGREAPPEMRRRMLAYVGRWGTG